MLKPFIQSKNPLWLVALYGLFALVFVGLLITYACRPHHDPDFWWHLKTGELIFKGRALLPADPFNFTGDPSVVTSREKLILNGYWLWQIVAYSFYQNGGWLGVKLLNGLTLAGVYIAIGISLYQSRIRPLVALALLSTSLFLFKTSHLLDRPQIVSFFFATVLVGFFVAIRRGSRPSFWLFPIMAAWGNMHGGVIVGTLLLALFGIGSAWDFRYDVLRRRAIVLWCLGGLLASLANPNGLDTYLGTIDMMRQGLSSRVTEYRSTFWVFMHKGQYVAILWGLALAYLAALWCMRRKTALADWLISLLIIAMSICYMRNVGFLEVSLLPLGAFYLSSALATDRKADNHLKRLMKWGLVIITCVISLGSIYAEHQTWKGLAGSRYARSNAPESLADFLVKVGVTGNLLNQYDWGGYLIWKLYPQYKVFIDGRGLDEQVYRDYFKIVDASLSEKGGVPEYQRLLEKYHIDYVAMSNRMEFGTIQTLLKYLLKDKDWYPIYLDDVGFLLAKSGPKTRRVIASYGIDKVGYLNQLLTRYNQSVQKHPEDADFYLGRGDLLGYLGRYEEAARDFDRVQQLNPRHPWLKPKLAQLQKLREGAAGSRR